MSSRPPIATHASSFTPMAQPTSGPIETLQPQSSDWGQSSSFSPPTQTMTSPAPFQPSGTNQYAPPPPVVNSNYPSFPSVAMTNSNSNNNIVTSPAAPSYNPTPEVAQVPSTSAPNFYSPPHPASPPVAQPNFPSYILPGNIALNNKPKMDLPAWALPPS